MDNLASADILSEMIEVTITWESRTWEFRHALRIRCRKREAHVTAGVLGADLHTPGAPGASMSKTLESK